VRDHLAGDARSGGSALRGVDTLAPPGIGKRYCGPIPGEGTMSEMAALLDSLKRTLKARRISYAQVAERLGLSEASVKRLLSKGGLTLERFEEICALAGTSVTELAKGVDNTRDYVSQLTPQQEREIMSDPTLLLVALCALNHLTIDQITGVFNLTQAECIRMLVKLDRLKFLELLPNNRIKLLVTRAFTWLPNGPIQQYFKTRAQHDFFRARFDGPGEIMLLVNGLLSAASSAGMIERLRRLANEFTEMNHHDAHLPLGERRPATLILAMRPWELEELHALRRPKRK
jgi:transcriptional regulator with XRE-family HTH domain